MLDMFYSRKLSKADRNQAFVLRRRMESTPPMKLNFWDDSQVKKSGSDTVQDMIREEAKLVKSIKTNFNMATVRFMRFIQELEIRYAFSMDDRVLEIDMDGRITFHLNNIDGWHP